MKLVLLGTGGYHPNSRRHTACIVVPTAGLVFDAGTSIFRLSEYLASDEVDLFLSHAHLDHCVGLTYLHDVLEGRSLRRLTIRGEAAKLAAIDQHLFSPLIFPPKLPWQFEPLAEPITLVDGGRVTWFPLEHPGGSLGYRVDWPGHSLAYVTDVVAREGADYVRAIAGVDLLVHECNFCDASAEWAEQTGHSTTSAVARVARQAGVGRLVLTHFNPLDTSDDPVGLATARAIFAATELASDLAEFEF